MTDEQLAGFYFDQVEVPGLVSSGMNQEGIDHLRARYIEDATANPRAVLELREWADEIYG